MRVIFLIYGGNENNPKTIQKLLSAEFVVLAQIIDPEIMRSLPQYEFASIVSAAEGSMESISDELRRKGVRTRLETEWGPAKEKLENLMKLYEADKILVFDDKTDIAARMINKIIDIKGVEVVS